MMTDNDIIKALELCVAGRCSKKCPYAGDDDCQEHNGNDILDLINRQKAEIERLEVELDAMRGAANSYKMHFDKAIKEFAEAIKEKAGIRFLGDDKHFAYVITASHLDNLAKEMTEETT